MKVSYSIRGRVERCSLVFLSAQCRVPHSRQWFRGQVELDLISRDIVCRHVTWGTFMFSEADIFDYSFIYLFNDR